MNARRMRTAALAAKPRSRQEGYALLMVVFMTTAMLILAMMVAPSILTEGRREREKEMIWRGKQYVRGVKLYYRKLGKFPTSLDDLTKPKIGSLRFMRQAYKDPMNEKDGSWRLIYVGPAGNLIGSLNPSQQNLAFGQAPIGTPVSSLAAPGAPGNPPQGGVLFGQSGPPGGVTGTQGSGFGQFGQSAGGAQPGGAGSGTNPSGTGITGAPVSADQGTLPGGQAIPMGDTPNIVGGNIIGVGSTVNKPSIMVYEKAKNYRLFEFIWNPSKEGMNVGQPGMQTGNGMGQIPGANPIGQPINPQQNPQQPQNPPPQQPQNPQQ